MEDTRRLLAVIKRNEFLYNCEHNDYNNLKKRFEVWRQIAQISNMSCHRAFLKWNSLRNSSDLIFLTNYCKYNFQQRKKNTQFQKIHAKAETINKVDAQELIYDSTCALFDALAMSIINVDLEAEQLLQFKAGICDCVLNKLAKLQ